MSSSDIQRSQLDERSWSSRVPMIQNCKRSSRRPHPRSGIHSATQHTRLALGTPPGIVAMALATSKPCASTPFGSYRSTLPRSCPDRFGAPCRNSRQTRDTLRLKSWYKQSPPRQSPPRYAKTLQMNLLLVLKLKCILRTQV